MPWPRTAPVDDACSDRLRTRVRERIASRIELEREARRTAALSHVRGMDDAMDEDVWYAELQQEAQRMDTSLDEIVRNS